MIIRDLGPLDVMGREEIAKIHEISLEVLQKEGVDFHNEEARNLFKENGARVEGKTVYIPARMIEEQLKLAPASFNMYARNPDRKVTIGGKHTVLAPGYGSPFVMNMETGKRRGSTFQDYIDFTKLAGNSTNIDVVGGVLVEPDDIPDNIRHAKMIYTGVKYTDKALMGSSMGAKKALDSVKMAAIIYGGEDYVKNHPVLVSLINTNSPLQFDNRMTEALMVYARYNQPTIISSLSMTGTTAPSTIAAALVQQNTEIISGITLAQLVNPGAPVIYGSASSVVDLKTGNLAIGSPETAKMFGGTAQLARFYDIPSRGGGCLTDSLIPDAQSGYESMMVFLTSVCSGFNFILHSAGLLENYMTMCFEKFVMDDEICGMSREYMGGIKIDNEYLGKETILDVGSGGHFLSTDHTYRHMKELRQPNVSMRDRYMSDCPLPDIIKRSRNRYQKILEEYEAPPLDKEIDKKLLDFINNLG